ncbi:MULTISPECIES: hypothetical protein [unclassified Streptomyces]|uniref:hypothetical protein n=1 Tax=unclassified Streptomyces TaxID=2593676 RepID=UPI000B4FF085|nr:MULTISPECIES: hypothetical protein [unclassified Streptomyces]MYW98898.1 hypothetical protein [Streptomyces sp. SID8378]
MNDAISWEDRMRWTTEEQTAIREHAAMLSISTQDYIRQSAASRALDWQRQRDASREMARRRGTSVEEILQQGMLTDDTA